MDKAKEILYKHTKSNGCKSDSLRNPFLEQAVLNAINEALTIPDIDKPTIASELIIEATEMKGKRPTQLNFEELIDVVESVVKKLTIPAVVGQSEQLVCEYCNEDAKPTCCDSCLEGMVNAVQKAN